MLKKFAPSEVHGKNLEKKLCKNGGYQCIVSRALRSTSQVGRIYIKIRKK